MKKLLRLLVLSSCFIAVGALGSATGKQIYTENIYLCLFVDTDKSIWVHGFGDDQKKLFTKDPKNLPAGSTQIGQFTHKEYADLSITKTTIHVYTCTKKPTSALPFFDLTGANAGIFSEKNDKELANQKNYLLVGQILVYKQLVSQAELETALKNPEKLAEEKKLAEEEKKRLATPANYSAYFLLDSTTGTLKVLYYIDGSTNTIRIGTKPDFLKDQKLDTLGTYVFKFNDKKTVDDILTAQVAIDFEKPPFGYELTTITDPTILTVKAERAFLAQNQESLTEAANKLLEKIKQEKLEKERIDIPKVPEPKKQAPNPADKPENKPELEPKKNDSSAIDSFAASLIKLV